MTTSNKVQRFYDSHPYPSPVLGLDKYRQLCQSQERLRADYHLHWPKKPFREDLSILVAGCGTAQAAKHALRHPEAKVIGIDISSTSIRHTETLKQQYQLTNLELHHLSLDKVQILGQQFDKIVCTGVLHHLPDPDAGLRALRDVLTLDGAMHLMVYATYGRTGIYMLQDYCRRLGIGTSNQEVRDLANTLMALPQDHPLATLLAGSPDFRTKAGLADALLHPQDRAYSVPQLFGFIDQAGLTFGRWVRQAPYLPQCGALAQTPHTVQLTGLSPKDQYAAVELFRGTMLRHNVIVYRTDRPDDGQPIRFDGEQWPNYVPIRLPRTVCVQQRLPPGATGVLINQNHTYPDLVLPIDNAEKRLFDAIDGHRSIAEIVDKAPAQKDQSKERVRTFFERLWWYDQVVFDAS